MKKEKMDQEKQKSNKDQEKDQENSEKPDVKIVVGDHELIAKYREFKSGKKGYGVYGVHKINNWPCRLSLNLIEM